MNTMTDTALRGLVGLVVLAALYITIWAARDSSARVAPLPPAPDVQGIPLDSARTHRAPVTHTAITPAQLQRLSASPARP